MLESFHIRLDGPRFVFSAAHFITYNGDACEPLHGHNYHVAAEIHGPLDENHYVIDFIAARRALEEIVLSLDHRVLLPTRHKSIRVWEQDREPDGAAGAAGAVEVVAEYGDRRWVFPRQDCVLVDVENTTAELLARHIALRLRAAVEPLAPRRLSHVRVAVDECDGQWGVCELGPQQ